MSYYHSEPSLDGISDRDINKVNTMIEAYRKTYDIDPGYSFHITHEYNLSRLGEFPAEYRKTILKLLRRYYNLYADLRKKHKKKLKNLQRFLQTYQGKRIKYKDGVYIDIPQGIRRHVRRHGGTSLFATLRSLKDGRDVGTAILAGNQRLTYEVLEEL